MIPALLGDLPPKAGEPLKMHGFLLGHASCLEVSSVQHFKEELHLSWAPSQGGASHLRLREDEPGVGYSRLLITPRPQHSPQQGCLGDPAAPEPLGSQVSLWLGELPFREGWGTPQSQCASKPSFCPVERTDPFLWARKGPNQPHLQRK